MLSLLLSIAASATTLAAQPQTPAPTAIHLPAGFRATVYARGLDHPTAMAFGPDGRLYVTEDVGDVVISAPGSKAPKLFQSGLKTPLGLVWKDKTLYVSEQGRMEAFGLGEQYPVADNSTNEGRQLNRRVELTLVPLT